MERQGSKKLLNKYYRHSRIDDWTFDQLVRYFALDFTASDAALLTGLTRKTVTTIFIKIRRRLAQECERQFPFAQHKFNGNGSGGQKGRCHALTDKNIVFGLFNRDGNIYTEIVPDCLKPSLRAVILGHLTPDAVTRSKDWRGYEGLADFWWEKHILIECGQDGFARNGKRTDDIESFWSFSRRRLSKFKGVPPRTFYLHLKECEWRFNNQLKDSYQELLKLLQEHPL